MKLGRNDPCSCGSGKKYKKCCENVQKTSTESPAQVVMGVGWYLPEQWDRLREISEDRSELEDTYAEWVAMAEKSCQDLRAQGVDVYKIFVDVDELEAWCLKHGRAVTAEARAAYYAAKVQEESTRAPHHASLN